MRSQIYDSCASLTAFCSISKSSEAEVRAFKLKIVQLFSAFHAMAMASVAQTNRKFPVICAEVLPKTRVDFLEDLPLERKTEVVYQWIQVLIMNEVDHGVLHQVPPPILNGAYAELGKALSAYIEIMQIITLPFPFPYSQAALLMIILYMIVAPFVMVGWTHDSASAFLFTFFSAMCFWSLELIAAELENPFGNDINDLPVWGFQDDINRGLLLLMDPMNEKPLELSEEASGIALSKAAYAKALASDWSTIDSPDNASQRTQVKVVHDSTKSMHFAEVPVEDFVAEPLRPQGQSPQFFLDKSEQAALSAQQAESPARELFAVAKTAHSSAADGRTIVATRL